MNDDDYSSGHDGNSSDDVLRSVLTIAESWFMASSYEVIFNKFLY